MAHAEVSLLRLVELLEGLGIVGSLQYVRYDEEENHQSSRDANEKEVVGLQLSAEVLVLVDDLLRHV